MKRIALVTLIGLLAGSLIAQDSFPEDSSDNEYRTIFKKKDGGVRVSGFGGPMMSFGSIDGGFAHMMGGGGGVMVNNFFFGGYGMGLTTPINYKFWDEDNVTGDPAIVTSETEILSFGHGGFWAGYVIAPKYPVHLSISSKFGWGAIGSTLRDGGTDPYFEQALFVISPVAEVELNFSRFFKVGVGATTSYVRLMGNEESAYDEGDFLNPNVFLSFKFGWFD